MTWVFEPLYLNKSTESFIHERLTSIMSLDLYFQNALAMNMGTKAIPTYWRQLPATEKYKIIL